MPRHFVLNYDQQLENPEFIPLHVDDPVVLLVEQDTKNPIYQRHAGQAQYIKTQVAELPGEGDAQAVESQTFSMPRLQRYGTYKVLRLDSGYGEHAPRPVVTSQKLLGDVPPAPLTTDAQRKPELTADGLASAAAAAQGSSEFLHLFNVIVALEWVPSVDYLRRLEWAFRRASDLLYDISNGCMAFGQVVFGGQSAMRYADIQITASNRSLPRSWVGGLLIEEKYTPIRLGCALWDRRRKVTIDWDEPDGFGAIVHEWCHYALSLKDEYLETVYVEEDENPRVLRRVTNAQDAIKLVLPTPAITSPSIMATAQGNSELDNPLKLGSDDDARRVLEQWRRYYPGLYERVSIKLTGPGRLPFPFPVFRYVSDLSQTSYWNVDEAIRDISEVLVHDQKLHINKAAGERWELYVVRPTFANPQHVVAQGQSDARTGTKPVLLRGAKIGNQIVLAKQTGMHVQLWTGTLKGTRQEAGIEWDEQIPATFAGVAPLTIAVVPGTPKSPTEPTLRLSRDTQIGRAAAFELGVAEPDGRTVEEFPPQLNQDQPKAVGSLDGHLLVEQDGHPKILSYSQGGGPQVSPNVITNPISAGSANGDLLLFFKDNGQDKRQFDDVRIVCTVHPHVSFTTVEYEDERLLPLGPLFAIAGNDPLFLTADIDPTMMLLNHSDDEVAGVLAIGRISDNKIVELLPTYSAPGASFAAARIGEKHFTAEDEKTRVAYFRLYARLDKDHPKA